jgi:hypothetical protein
MYAEYTPSTWKMGPGYDWSKTSIGTSSDGKTKYNIGNAGCVITWVANVLTGHGIATNPGQLYSSNKDYFDKQGNIDWSITNQYGFTHDYWTREKQETKEHKNGFMEQLKSLLDSTTGYAISARTSIWVQSAGLDGEWEEYTIGIKGVTKDMDGEWAEVSQTSDYDTEAFRNGQNTGMWKTKNGKLYVRTFSLSRIDILKRSTTDAPQSTFSAVDNFLKKVWNSLFSNSSSASTTSSSGNSSTPSSPAAASSPSDTSSAPYHHEDETHSSSYY